MTFSKGIRFCTAGGILNTRKTATVRSRVNARRAGSGAVAATFRELIKAIITAAFSISGGRFIERRFCVPFPRGSLRFPYLIGAGDSVHFFEHEQQMNRKMTRTTPFGLRDLRITYPPYTPLYQVSVRKATISLSLLLACTSRDKPWESLLGSSATTPTVDFHHRPTACPSYRKGEGVRPRFL